MKKRSLSKGIIELKGPTQIHANLKNISPNLINLLSPNVSKNVTHIKSNASQEFNPNQLFSSRVRCQKPLSSFQRHMANNQLTSNSITDGKNGNK